jgi:hypothetical protein
MKAPVFKINDIVTIDGRFYKVVIACSNIVLEATTWEKVMAERKADKILFRNCKKK